MDKGVSQRRTLSFKRILSVAALFCFLGFYLWGFQIAYDNTKYGWMRALLFSLIIFGGGMSWDFLKEIARLPDQRLNKFVSSANKGVGTMILYFLLFTIGYLVLKEWAGIATIGVGFYFIGSLVSLYFCFIYFEEAVNAVMDDGASS